jgi:DNA invertase Pin-like site-specific DNA recombinase
MRKIGYARVSTADQDLRLQIDALLKDGVREPDIYRETVSGAKQKRDVFDRMMRELRPDDIVTVWKLDRLSRSLPTMLRTIEEIHSKGAKLRILTQQIDTSTAGGKLFLNMLMVIADFEREIGRERTIAGLAAARERGRTGGRKPTFTDDQIREAKRLREQGAPWPKAAASIGISLTRLQARIRQLCPTN